MTMALTDRNWLLKILSSIDWDFAKNERKEFLVLIILHCEKVNVEEARDYIGEQRVVRT